MVLGDQSLVLSWRTDSDGKPKQELGFKEPRTVYGYRHSRPERQSLRRSDEQVSAALAFEPVPPAPVPGGIRERLLRNAAAVAEQRAERPRNGQAEIIKSNIGWKLDPDDWARRSAASAILDDQSRRLADALGRMGVDVRAESDVSLVGAITGQVADVTAYKAVRFLPAVAARDRRPILNGLRFFIEKHPNSKFFRYAVMTAPEPVRAGDDLRSVVAGLSRRISKWAVEARAAGVEVLYRGIEYTRATAAERGMADRFPPDTVLYHVHANVMTWPTRRMRDEEWKAFLAMTWTAVKAHWKDNGRLQDAAELVKYCFKPGQLDGATDHEILWLYEQTRRLKIAQPLGVFAAFMRELEEAGEKVVRKRRGSSSELVRVRKSERFDHAAREERDAKESTSAGAGPGNVLLGISLPQWRWTPWAEPMLLVRGYDPSPVGEGDRRRLDDLYAERGLLRQAWDASGAPEPSVALAVAAEYASGKVTAMPARRDGPYRVHTCRPTVRSEAEGGGPTCASPPPERSEEGRLVFLRPPPDTIDPYAGPHAPNRRASNS